MNVRRVANRMARSLLGHWQGWWAELPAPDSEKPADLGVGARRRQDLSGVQCHIDYHIGDVRGAML